MTDRITQSMLSTTLLGDLQTITDKLTQTRDKLSSGKEIQKPSDNPYGTSRALQLRADLAANKQYQTNVSDASSWQDATDISLGQIGDLSQRARDLLVQGANDTLGASGRASIATEIDQIIESVKSIGNTQYAGRYLFAGSKTTTAPYTPGGADAYLGDTATISREIGQGVQVPLNIDGKSAIGDGTTAGSLLATLRKISTDLKANNSSALQSGDLATLDTALDGLTSTRATVGARTNRLDTALSRLQQIEQTTTGLLSNTEDADMAKTLVDFSQQQAVYQAALKSGAQVIQLSLMDFLR
ncbi:MAG: flagellar hook-associated protein 3 [Actinomycetia bacterium]|jgi:flagellar hook-associated protein 3 FlgL|nr:flagellar hook-associated protein 3 [Actinomycetes bacterium]